MRKLTKPTRKAGETFATCISLVRDPAMRQHLAALRPRVEAAATDYEAKASLAQWHRVVKTGALGPVPKNELVKTYSNRMAKSNGPGRSIYDELIIVPQRRCPLCGQRDVSTLDHYLPEAHYSLLTVLPVNLIPSCKDCNFKKRDAVPGSAETQTFHPYYDNFDDGTWLKAELVNVDPLCVVFEVVRPDGWSATKVARARHHFGTLELDALYSDHAASEFIEIKGRLRELHNAGGKAAVREDLESTAKSITQRHPNSWRGALYVAASATDWFCEGGFEAIAE